MCKKMRLISLLLIIVILAACTPTQTETDVDSPDVAEEEQTSEEVAESEDVEEKEPVVVTFMRPGFGDDALMEVEAQLAPFYEMYPYITVETQILPPPEVGTKLQTSLAGGAPPDIVQGISVGDAYKFSDSGQFLDLTPLAEADGFDWQNYFDTANIEFYNKNGRLECIAESSDTRTLAYNKTMFDAAGLDYPTDDWTWDDLLEAAKALTIDTDGDGQIDQWGFATHTWDFQPWIWAAGGSLFNEDYSEILITDPVVKETMQFLVDLQYEHGVWPPQEVSATFPEIGFMFAQNQLAMYTARWIPDTVFFFAGIEEFEWDVVMMPMHPETGLRAAGKGGGCIGAFAATEHPEETYLVWKWMTSDEGVYARSVGSNGIPMLPGGSPEVWTMSSEAFNTVESPSNAAAFVQMLPYTRFSDLPLANAAEINAAMGPYMDELWLGIKTVEEVAPLIKEAVDPLLN